ncbi:hypothetical protein KJ632_00290 [Patescibacteria group bacterium]|nr:hypothetical protein [Patescibacteria group bacterium]
MIERDEPTLVCIIAQELKDNEDCQKLAQLILSRGPISGDLEKLIFGYFRAMQETYPELNAQDFANAFAEAFKVGKAKIPKLLRSAQGSAIHRQWIERHDPTKLIPTEINREISTKIFGGGSGGNHKFSIVFKSSPKK